MSSNNLGYRGVVYEGIRLTGIGVVGTWLFALYLVLIWLVIGTLSSYGFQDKLSEIQLTPPGIERNFLKMKAL